MAAVKLPVRPRGEVVMSAKAYVHVLSESERDIRCDTCFELDDSNEKLRRCSRCHVMSYCNVDCQSQDWPLHKVECRCLRQVAPHIPSESARLMFRLILRHMNDDHKTVKERVGKTDRCFDDLMSHVEEIRQDSERMQQFNAMCHTLKKFAGDEMDLPLTPILLSTFGKMTTNSFSICDSEMNPIGVGIYLKASVLDHRCQPNAVITFKGTELTVRSTAEKKDKFEQVYISYIDQLATSKERKEQLYQQYYFDCDCVMCLDDELDIMMVSARCPNRCEPPLTLKRNGRYPPCSQCGNIGDEEFVVRVELAVAQSKEALEQIKTLQKSNDAAGVLAACEECFGHQASLLHPLNVYRVRVLDKALDACLDLQHWQRALEYGMETIEPYRRLYPPYHPNVGLQLMKVGKLQLYLQLHQDALRALMQAEDILKVTHGAKNHLLIELRDLIMQCQDELRAEMENGD